MTDVVERLRLRSESWETADGAPMYGPGAVLDRQAADEIERLRAEIERLRAVINAWADAEDSLGLDGPDPWMNLRRAVGR